MKTQFLLLGVICLSGCADAPDAAALDTSSQTDSVTVDASDGPATDHAEPVLKQVQIVASDDFPVRTDPYQIESVRIEGDRLIVSVSSGGGCEEHKYTVLWTGETVQDAPTSAVLQIVHDDRDDMCEAIVGETLKVDLTRLKDHFTEHEAVMIELHGFSHRLRYSITDREPGDER